MAGVDFLRQQSDVDTARVGVVGFSQGGYVAALVAATDPASKFTAVISGGTASLLTQIVDEVELEAERGAAPLSRAASARLRTLYLCAFNFATRRTGWPENRARVEAARRAGGPLASAIRTLPLDSTHWAFGWMRAMGDFDPMPYWRRASQRPVLFVFGGRDYQLRLDSTLARLRGPAGRILTNMTIIEAGGNAHALFRDDVVAFLASWIQVGGRD